MYILLPCIAALVVATATQLPGGAPPPLARLDGPALLARLRDEYGQGQRSFRIPAGVYSFPNAGERDFALNGWTDAVIDASGATFLLNSGGVKFNHCARVTLKGLTLDNDPFPAMQGIVKAIDRSNKTLDITLDPAYQAPPAGGIARTNARGIVFFPPDGRDPVREEWEASYGYESMSGNDYRIKLLNNRFFDVGDHPDSILPGYRVFVAAPNGSSGITLTGCDHVTLVGVHVYAGDGFSICELGGKGDNVYRDCVIGRKPGTDRLMKGGRDGFHSYGMRKGPTIEGCDISYTGDDLIAIHGFWDIVETQPEPTKIVLAAPFSRDFEIGSTLRFYDFDTTRPRGEAIVRSFIRLTGPESKARIQAVPSAMAQSHYAVRDFPDNLAELIEVTLDRPVQIAPLTIASSGEYCGNGAVIRGNHLHDAISRGVLVKANDITIEGNTMERISLPAIAILPESYWLEGPFVHRIRIANNTIVDCGEVSYNDRYMEPMLGAIQIANTFGHRLFNPPTFNGYATNSQVTIEGNRVIRPAVFAIFLGNVDGAAIKNNTIDHAHRRRAWIDKFDLSGAIVGGSGPDPVTDAQIEVLKHPLFSSLVLGSSNVAISGNKVVSDLPGYLGDWGIGPWTRAITVENSAAAKH
ncbi:MAG: right-handed parallel beta-helix repeat-containing protein [Capsulimonadaceae bacterium]|nr:right-handed parallel beta-helix repeat-containing protein [Capsulimonadaceae bacterium]